MDLNRKGVVVTGASRGLGAALAAKLAARGARVVLVARGKDALEQTASRIRAAGGEAHVIVGDVADPDAAFRIAGMANALAGPIDVLVHNASTLGPVPLRPLLDTSPEEFTRTLDANLTGPLRITQALVGAMVLRREGIVVHVSSDAAVQAYPAWGAYSASKAALDHLNRIWAVELAGTGVVFLSVDPGEMNTEMHARALPDADVAGLADPAEVAQRIVALLGTTAAGASGTRVTIHTEASQ
jgi:NAD(P)-dependent dehydrogenase (short-subunit alcohol dehydrogenase family)